MPVWEVECYGCSTVVGRYTELPDACEARASHYETCHQEPRTLTTFILRGLADSGMRGRPATDESTRWRILSGLSHR
jgi:hypothetical protein